MLSLRRVVRAGRASRHQGSSEPLLAIFHLGGAVFAAASRPRSYAVSPALQARSNGGRNRSLVGKLLQIQGNVGGMMPHHDKITRPK